VNLLLASIALALSFPAWASDLPGPVLTPGAINLNVTQENIQQTVCVKGHTKTIRPPSLHEPLKKQQIRAYDYTDTNPKHYEEDYLVPLSIGGNPRDPRNLRPEPRNSELNAAKKDDLKFVLYRKVCANEISLKDAQTEIASNWIEAYKMHVHEKGRRHGRGYDHVD
jgi:hypothetical protein